MIEFPKSFRLRQFLRKVALLWVATSLCFLIIGIICVVRPGYVNLNGHEPPNILVSVLEFLCALVLYKVAGKIRGSKEDALPAPIASDSQMKGSLNRNQILICMIVLVMLSMETYSSFIGPDGSPRRPFRPGVMVTGWILIIAASSMFFWRARTRR